MNLDERLEALAATARGDGIACDPATIFHRHGDYARWREAFSALPAARPSVVDFGATVRIGRSADLGGAGSPRYGQLNAGLRGLTPWRKGPFAVFGIEIDSEWRSDWKWGRVAAHLPDLVGQRVLDVGCSNGYYGWRMLAAGARHIIGCDPTPGYVAQYLALAAYLEADPRGRENLVLPVGLEALPADIEPFDTVFSMGVLYHRRDPQAHVDALRDRLRPGGTLVLETLIVPGPEPLRPAGRYARMRNVHEIPSTETLALALGTAGLRDVRIVDVTPTSTAEQRRTEWMPFESLAEALDPREPTRTVEGHPAPVRAIALAVR